MLIYLSPPDPDDRVVPQHIVVMPVEFQVDNLAVVGLTPGCAGSPAAEVANSSLKAKAVRIQRAGTGSDDGRHSRLISP